MSRSAQRSRKVGLNALDIPHGSGGTKAAIEYLGESVAP
jgi:alanine-glyoxylate transaminase / serine-glyoxylate transaminase / serine-pyruvate transaminase